MASSEKKLLIVVDAAFALLGRALLAAVLAASATCNAGAFDEASDTGGEGTDAALGAEVAGAETGGVVAATVGVSVDLGDCRSWNEVDAVTGVEEFSSCTLLVDR